MSAESRDSVGPAGKKKGVAGGSGQRSPYRVNENRSRVGWEVANATTLWQVVAATTRAGDAILFGGTRSGDILVCTVCSGEERIKFYWSTASAVEEGLQEIIEAADFRSGHRK